ncbi:hypothetical protein [Paenibacillus thermotolerans]|uniref:hypothetical protein n=1 Tax=Paenibacillus thermotolerans TaxID=3027807 RepID=UPI00236782D0|nr:MULTISPECIES: hypothetical protein [unclassified Paenibacillus]
MKTKINIKELCKRIRYGRTRGGMVWSREDNRHFITNRHWLVRFDELPREVKIELFSVFCKIPEVGQTLNIFAGQESETKPVKYDNIYQPDKQDAIGEVTPFMKEIGEKHFARVLKFPEHFAFNDEDYFKLAEGDSDIKTQGNSPLKPVYLAGGDLLVLPIRVSESGNDTTIKELTEAVSE